MMKMRKGELESAVMEILWDAAGHLTPSQVSDALNNDALNKDRPLAYTTVMTILVRLFEKGRLDRERRGRAFAYRPLLSREEYAAARMSELLVETRDKPLALSYFVDGLKRGDRERLRGLLDRGRS